MHNGHTLAAEPVKEAALAHIWAADEGHGSGWIDHAAAQSEGEITGECAGLAFQLVHVALDAVGRFEDALVAG